MNTPGTLSLTLAACTLACALAACGGADRGGGPKPDANPGLPAAFNTRPQDLGDGWAVSSAEDEQVDATAVQAVFQSMSDGGFTKIDSMLVARHGKLVAEGYFNGFGRDSLHDLRSTGKSFTSALAGIAIQQGFMGLDDPISQLVPGFEGHKNMSERKRAITVRNLLDMNSGLECDDWVPSSAGNEEKMYGQRDWVGFILDLPMAHDAGLVASYCTGGVVVLGSIVATRSGMSLDNYAQTYLFTPLGIQQTDWRRSPDGQATGGGGLRLRPRDAAKFGELYRAGGTWNGARIVPASWVEMSRERPFTLNSDGYGLLWWKRAFPHAGTTVECFFTSGNGGNFIFVVPALELVAVFTGSNYNSSLGDQPLRIMAERLIPAVH